MLDDNKLNKEPFSASTPNERMHDSFADPNTSEERNPVEILAEEFAARIRNGETPSIDDYVQKCPQFEKEIKLIFPSIQCVEKVSNEEADDRNVERNSNRFFQKKIETIADFEIIREIGRGGMGVVYMARQKSLNRLVALKTINPAISNSEIQLQRFQREAEAVARLHHTNIVQVFGTGEADNIHFFAMQLIDGCSLASWIQSAREHFSHENRARDSETDRPKNTLDNDRRLDDSIEPTIGLQSPTAEMGIPSTERSPLSENSPAANFVSTNPKNEELLVRLSNLSQREYIREACKIVANVASAIQYAHEQGVLHRDIKPANLLMDREGTVWITDFGLAKINDIDELTQTGNLIGTLRYMAPEQFDGKFDERSDIYSLGLTLYELLALQPAFDSLKKSHAVNISSKRKSPVSLRSINANIPRDVEIITAKAISVEPNHRYSTAQEFADELHRFLDDRPVKSRAVPKVELAWRWAKRNPAVATLSSIATLLLISVAVVATIGTIQTREALAGMESEYERAEQQKQIANQNLQITKNGIQQLVQKLSSRGVFQQRNYRFGEDEFVSTTTRLSDADVEMLFILLDVYQKFSSTNDTDLSRETAEAYAKAGDILQKLGRYREAVDSYEQSLAIHQTNLSQPDGSEPSAEEKLQQIRLFNEIAVTASLNGDLITSTTAFQSAKELFNNDQKLAMLSDGKFEYARTLNIFASSGSRIGQYLILDRGPGLRGRPWGPGESYLSYRERGNRERPGRRGQVDENGSRRGMPSNGDSFTVGKQGRSGFGDERSRGSGRGVKGRGFGWMGKKPGSGDQKYDERKPQHLGKFEPNRNRPGPPPLFGFLGFGGPRPPEPNYFHDHRHEFILANKEAEQILIKLIDGEPTNAIYRLALARCLGDRLRLDRRSNESKNQETVLEKISEILDQLIEQYPASPVYLFEKAAMLHSYNTNPRITKPSLLQKARQASETLTTNFPDVFEYQSLLADTIAKEASVNFRSPNGRNEALANYQQVIDIYERLTTAHSDAHQFQLAYVIHLYEFSDLNWKLKNYAKAKQLLTTATHVFAQVDFGGGDDSPAAKIRHKIEGRLQRPELK